MAVLCIMRLVLSIQLTYLVILYESESVIDYRSDEVFMFMSFNREFDVRWFRVSVVEVFSLFFGNDAVVVKEMFNFSIVGFNLVFDFINIIFVLVCLEFY